MTLDLQAAIAAIKDLANEANVKHNVKTVTENNDGTLGILTYGGQYGVAGRVTKDDHGLALAPPSRIKRSVNIQTQGSLVDYIGTFKQAGTTLFANITTNQIRAALDYHVNPEMPSYVQHFAVMTLPYSYEWDLWTKISGQMLGQLEFARFIEENSGDISFPSGADVLEMCRDLQSKREVNFIKSVRTSSDNESFQYSDTTSTSTKGGVDMITKFSLSIPVYFDGAPVTVDAYLRWKISDERKLSLGIVLSHAEQVRQAMFKMIAKDISSEAQVPVIYGSIGE